VRQKESPLKETVEQLADDNVPEAVENLVHQGRVHEIRNDREHLTEIVRPELPEAIFSGHEVDLEFLGRLHK
jgi:hypothetical protein